MVRLAICNAIVRAHYDVIVMVSPHLISDTNHIAGFFLLTPYLANTHTMPTELKLIYTFVQIFCSTLGEGYREKNVFAVKSAKALTINLMQQFYDESMRDL